jgi:hypothetical protein
MYYKRYFFKKKSLNHSARQPKYSSKPFVLFKRLKIKIKASIQHPHNFIKYNTINIIYLFIIANNYKKVNYIFQNSLNTSDFLELVYNFPSNTQKYFCGNVFFFQLLFPLLLKFFFFYNINL